MLIIAYMLNGCPLCKSLYLVLILFQSFGWSKTFLIIKSLISTIIPFIQHSFDDWFSFLLLATIKIEEQLALNTINPFYLFFQTWLCVLPITSSRYSVYQLLGKVENSSFSTQICQKKNLGLEFQESNLRITISILKI